jgi:hypothetical protein
MEIFEIVSWHDNVCPKPSNVDIKKYLANHISELSKTVELFNLIPVDMDTLDSCDFYTKLTRLKTSIANVVDALHSENIQCEVKNDVKMAETLYMNAHNSLGLGNTLGYDMQSICVEMNESMWSKFDEDYNPIFNEIGELINGPDYTPPNLDEYV